MPTLTVTAKGQITLKKVILEKMRIKPGQRVEAEVNAEGVLEIRPIAADEVRCRPRRSEIWRARGILYRPGRRPVSIEEMQQAIEAGASGE